MAFDLFRDYLESLTNQTPETKSEHKVTANLVESVVAERNSIQQVMKRILSLPRHNGTPKSIAEDFKQDADKFNQKIQVYIKDYPEYEQQLNGLHLSVEKIKPEEIVNLSHLQDAVDEMFSPIDESPKMNNMQQFK